MKITSCDNCKCVTYAGICLSCRDKKGRDIFQKIEKFKCPQKRIKYRKLLDKHWR